MAPRPIIVHSAEHIRAALEAAHQLGAEVTLRTAPGAAQYAGPLYLIKLVAQVVDGEPRPAGADRLAGVVLDCGGDGALAHAALRTGWRAVLFTGPARVRAEVCAAAAAHGATVLSRAAPALDLLDQAAPLAACHAWLKTDARA